MQPPLGGLIVGIETQPPTRSVGIALAHTVLHFAIPDRHNAVAPLTGRSRALLSCGDRHMRSSSSGPVRDRLSPEPIGKLGLL